VLVVLTMMLAACTSSQTTTPTTTRTVPPTTHPLPAIDLSATPTGWVPVAYGDAQVSVPASFLVVYPGTCVGGPSVALGALLIGSTSAASAEPACPASTKTPRAFARLVGVHRVPPPYASEKLTKLNGVPVYLGPNDLTRLSYYAPSLGVEITASGPVARRIADTLTRSPRAVALAHGSAPRVPSSWQSVTFAGLRFSVPSSWAVERSSEWDLCGPVGIALLELVVLDTDRQFLEAPCPVPGPNAVAPSDGVRVDSGPHGPTGSFSRGGGSCLHIGGLTACPSSTPDYSILLLRVDVPGRAKPVFVSIGLAENGMVARTILYSLRAA
jgi:hypothetical protein